MSSGNFSKYNFDNVLVADTRLLMSMSNPVMRPQIIVLNNKLNVKCRKHQTTSGCSSSATCCLQVDEPELRRRSDMIIVEADLSKHRCFANCGDRRNIDVELSARTQLNGRIVVLALTRVNQLTDERHIKRDPLRCDTETSWAYSRFEPSPEVVNLTARQTFYSLLRPNQAPSLMINTMGLQWDPRKLKETVSLAVQSNRSRKHLDVVTTETLLVIQLHCQPISISSKNWLYDEETIPSQIKVHLLALINRQVLDDRTLHAASRKALAKEDKFNQVEIGAGSDKNTTSNEIGGIPLESHIEIPGEVSQNLSSSKRSAIYPTKRELADHLSANTRSAKETPAISQRIDPPGNLLKSLFLAVPALQDKVDVKPNDTSSLGLSYLNELDSMRLRLKSNSLLLFTVSSSMVILVYTLCLFIYLKSRRHRATASKETHKQSARKTRSQREAKFPQQVGNISEPFNLQMAPATRTRLNMMLGMSTGRSSRVDPNSRPSKRASTRSARSHSKKWPNHGLTSSFTHNREPLGRPDRGYQCCAEDTSPGGPCNAGRGKAQTAHKSHIAYGTINVVRAIQQAATLARSRLRNSRYHSSLNVIPETDSEHSQSLPRKNMTNLGGLLNQDRQDQAQSVKTISPERFNSLVQNAMSRDCSHNLKKIFKQPTATLFSNPHELVSTGPPVSRSRILRQVKQENFHKKHSRQPNSDIA